MSLHIVPEKLNLVLLDSQKAFEQLNIREKLYAYSLYKASWQGAPIVAQQCSIESEDLLKLIQKMFLHRDIYSLQDELISKGFPKSDVVDMLNYFALVCANLGNYMSFGDNKIIPRLSKESMNKFFAIVFTECLEDYVPLCDKIYSLENNEKLLGYPPDNVSSYFTSNLTKDEIDIVDEYIVKTKLEGWNTRLVKLDSEETPLYIILLASALIPEEKHIIGIEVYKGMHISIGYGDYSKNLNNVCECLKAAREFASNDIQKQMINKYIEHFTYGQLDAHKESQKLWIQDKGPVVETNMGFIENYRDPAGKRAEFESFVSMVDKEKSVKLQTLVDNAPKFLDTLPWPKEFEKDTFNPPDFTALDILTFCNSGIPAGINIPNYDDIRSNYGFKNVSLDNVIRSGYSSDTEPTQFLSPDDDAMFKKFVIKAFAVDVAGHELLGHGSGKLFTEGVDGTLNFDNVTSPITNSLVSTWYKPGETFGSVFGRMGSAYEECRAECVGLYLSGNQDMHTIFSHTNDEWEDIMYTSWLWMIRAGVLSLLAYDPDKNMWMQAHSQARYVIYQVMKEAGQNFVSIEMTENSSNFVIKVDRSKINDVGVPALKNFLMKLNVLKSTADIENASNMFNFYSNVDADHLNIRTIYLHKRKPRTEYIQPSVTSSLEYKSYPVTPEGMIQSWLDKYPPVL